MRKMKIVSVLLCAVIMAVSLCACSGGTMTDGSFADNTYINRDMGIAITVDEYFSTTVKESSSELFQGLNVLEFFGVIVLREDLGGTSFLLDDEKIANLITNKLSEQGIETENKGTKTIAGKAFQHVTVKDDPMGLGMKIDYYIIKVKGSAAVISLTYPESSSEYAEEFLQNNIKAI